MTTIEKRLSETLAKPPEQKDEPLTRGALARNFQFGPARRTVRRPDLEITRKDSISRARNSGRSAEEEAIVRTLYKKFNEQPTRALGAINSLSNMTPAGWAAMPQVQRDAWRRDYVGHLDAGDYSASGDYRPMLENEGLDKIAEIQGMPLSPELETMLTAYGRELDTQRTAGGTQSDYSWPVLDMISDFHEYLTTGSPQTLKIGAAPRADVMEMLFEDMARRGELPPEGVALWERLQSLRADTQGHETAGMHLLGDPLAHKILESRGYYLDPGNVSY